MTILDSRFPFCMAQQIDLVSVFSLCLSLSLRAPLDVVVVVVRNRII